MKRTWIALLAITLILGLMLSVSVSAAPAKKIAPSDQYLSTQFTKNFGPGTITITDILKEGVRVDVTGAATAGSVGISDNFPVSPFSNLPPTPGAPAGDATGFIKYELLVRNIGTAGVNVNIYLNTGFTDPGPWVETGVTPATRDTFWEGNWTYIGPGKTHKLTLDFSNTTAWNIADEQFYLPAPANGTSGLAIFRLDEVSNIGFSVAAGDWGILGSASLIVNGPGD